MNSFDPITASRAVLIEVMNVLVLFRDEIVLVGGWVPDLLYPDRGHLGSLDVDLAVSRNALGPERVSADLAANGEGGILACRGADTLHQTRGGRRRARQGGSDQRPIRRRTEDPKHSSRPTGNQHLAGAGPRIRGMPGDSSLRADAGRDPKYRVCSDRRARGIHSNQSLRALTNAAKKRMHTTSTLFCITIGRMSNLWPVEYDACYPMAWPANWVRHMEDEVRDAAGRWAFLGLAGGRGAG